MADLVDFMNCSLDGYIEGETGKFGWSAPDPEAHRFTNEPVRPIGAYLYGRRMYEAMRHRERAEASDGQPSYVKAFAGIWRPAENVVYATTLGTASSARTRIERTFQPQSLRRWKEAS